jgi:hypothetical protein
MKNNYEYSISLIPFAPEDLYLAHSATDLKRVVLPQDIDPQEQTG